MGNVHTVEPHEASRVSRIILRLQHELVSHVDSYWLYSTMLRIFSSVEFSDEALPIIEDLWTEVSRWGLCRNATSRELLAFSLVGNSVYFDAVTRTSGAEVKQAAQDALMTALRLARAAGDLDALGDCLYWCALAESSILARLAVAMDSKEEEEAKDGAREEENAEDKDSHGDDPDDSHEEDEQRMQLLEEGISVGHCGCKLLLADMYCNTISGDSFLADWKPELASSAFHTGLKLYCECRELLHEPEIDMEEDVVSRAIALRDDANMWRAVCPLGVWTPSAFMYRFVPDQMRKQMLFVLLMHNRDDCIMSALPKELVAMIIFWICTLPYP